MRKVVLGVAVLLAVLVAGVFGYRAYLISELRKPVLAELNDPDSAVFRREEVVGPWALSKTVLCGEVNAKNRMGGFVGYRQFSATSDDAIVFDAALDSGGCGFEDDDTVKWWWLR
jgi:hypothetical protein